MNLRPSGYEPDELPDCSTPRRRTGSIRMPPLLCKVTVLSDHVVIDSYGEGHHRSAPGRSEEEELRDRNGDLL